MTYNRQGARRNVPLGDTEPLTRVPAIPPETLGRTLDRLREADESRCDHRSDRHWIGQCECSLTARVQREGPSALTLSREAKEWLASQKQEESKEPRPSVTGAQP